LDLKDLSKDVATEGCEEKGTVLERLINLDFLSILVTYLRFPFANKFEIMLEFIATGDKCELKNQRTVPNCWKRVVVQHNARWSLADFMNCIVSNQGMFTLLLLQYLPLCPFPFPGLHAVLSRAIASLLPDSLHTWSICCLWLIPDISTSSYFLFISSTLTSNSPYAALAFSCCFCGFIYTDELPQFNVSLKPWNHTLAGISECAAEMSLDEVLQSLTGRQSTEHDSNPCGLRYGVFHPNSFTLQVLSCCSTSWYYSATILQMSGVEDDRLAIWLAALTAFINFIFTLVGVWLVERMGRRKLTLGSLTGTAVALIILASGFLLSAQVSPRITLNPPDPSHQNSTCTKYSYCNGCMLDPDCGLCYKLNKSNVVESSCIPVDKDSTMKAAWGRCSNETVFKKEDLFWAYNFCPTPYSWTALLGLILYLVFFAPGMGPMPWTVNSEIYPLWARSTGNACSSGVNWVFNVLVSLTFLHTAEYLTYYGAFFLYAGFAALGLIFIYGCLPETKGKKLEEIESLFENRLCTCGMSDSDEGRYIEYIRVKGSNYHLSDNDASDVE
ncbi:MYCT protein, partial [Tyrannus savana]|nr:MYCT protein [Tyrannus savana]